MQEDNNDDAYIEVLDITDENLNNLENNKDFDDEN